MQKQPKLFFYIFLLIISSSTYALDYTKEDIKRIIPITFSSSNAIKTKEYSKFAEMFHHHLNIVSNSLPEIDSDAISVVAFKASMTGDDILVEDNSLDVEGADIGVNLKHRFREVRFYVGQPAIFRVLLAFQHKGNVFVFEGAIKGKIVSPKNPDEKNDIDAIFLPDGQTKTLAENKPDNLNIRYLAIKNLYEGNYIAILPSMKSWRGPWQIYP